MEQHKITNKARNKAYILGAGPAGLALAWKLLENGWDIEILERDNRVGGLCKSWEWGEFLLDVGPHIFHTPEPGLADLWEREFGDILLKGDFWCKNVIRENFSEYWDYPLSWESIHKYPPDLKEKILKELSTLNPADKARATNYQEYIRSIAGATLQEMFFERYPRKIWGISTEEMSPEWAPKRVEFRDKITPFYYGQWHAIGKFGTGCIFDRIKEKIIKLGGKIYLRSAVTGLVCDQKRIRQIELSDPRSVPVTDDDVIISTLPLTEAAKLLGYESGLEFRGVICVYLGFDKSTVLPEGIHWLYYDSDKVFFHRVSEPKKMTPFVAPKNRTFLVFEIAYSKGDAKDVMPRDELIRSVAQQAELVGLVRASDVTAAEVQKEEHVYPLMSNGYQQELANTKAAIGKYEQIYSIGAGGNFHYADVQILFQQSFDLAEILMDKYSRQTEVRRGSMACQPNPVVDINGCKIGEGCQPYIIAEAGMNHNGDLGLARKLVDEAKRIGCDAIKFQTFKPGSRISVQVKAEKYAETIIGLEETLSETFQRFAMSYDDQRAVLQYARSKGIEIFSTPFDFESVDFLESMGVNLYKIASMDLVNLPLIKYVAQKGKPVIISTGMSTLGEVEDAVRTVLEAGNANLMLLHCNSTYPAAPAEMNLRCINTLKSAFRVPVGLSDHTCGISISKIAMAIGANLIERHFTLNKNFEGPDHILSSDVEEFTDLVECSRTVLDVLGDGVKKIEPNEYETLNKQRKSIYAKTDIKKGDVITLEQLIIKGPGGGLLPKYLEIIAGREAKKNINNDHPVTWDAI